MKAALPGVMVMVAALFFESNLLVYGLSTAGLALMIGLHLLWVPLVKEE
jgi:presenilin-like A22 family membrane protease